jgi:hypothetical protein
VRRADHIETRKIPLSFSACRSGQASTWILRIHVQSPTCWSALGVLIAVVTNVTLDGYKKPASYGWDVTETFGYKLQVTGGSAAPTNTTYF